MSAQARKVEPWHSFIRIGYEATQAATNKESKISVTALVGFLLLRKIALKGFESIGELIVILRKR